jgi:DNA-binding transcriptional ArsR family regulator
MTANPNLSTVAALIGEPTRTAMLVELMCGRALTATELATRAEVAPSTASDHLAQLVRGGLLTCLAQGRHRYYRLASAEVARLIEAMGALADIPDPRGQVDPELAAGIKFARTCYDHLAGRLGVAVADALVGRDLARLEGDSFRLTSAGQAWLSRLGVDVAAARRAKRAFARACLDWTERRPHLAGSLGAALYARLVELGWLERLDGERTVELTPLGEAGLRTELGIRERPAFSARPVSTGTRAAPR